MEGTFTVVGEEEEEEGRIPFGVGFIVLVLFINNACFAAKRSAARFSACSAIRAKCSASFRSSSDNPANGSSMWWWGWVGRKLGRGTPENNFWGTKLSVINIQKKYDRNVH